MRKRDREFMRELQAEFRAFMREERVLSDRRFQQFTDEMRQMREDLHAHFAKQDRKIDDLIAENQAQRAALFQMLDRLGNGGTAPAA